MAQRDQSTNEATRTDASRPFTGPSSTTLEQARKFLQDDGVQAESREKKIEFLKSKGLDESQVFELLDGEKGYVPDSSKLVTEQNTTPLDSDANQDHPPVVTYPEFLTTRAKPPPLMTANAFLNALYTFGGLSTLMYGTSKFALAPMVESLVTARSDLYDTTAKGLARLTEQLEAAVSEVPPAKRIPPQTIDDDNASSCDDPTELFHRDIGVQTSPPASPMVSALDISPLASSRPAIVQQATRVTDLVAAVKDLNCGDVAQGSGSAQIRDVLDVLMRDIDALAPHHFINTGGYSNFVTSSRNEPDDEIRKVKENIRRVKGVLLSARSFPASVR